MRHHVCAICLLGLGLAVALLLAQLAGHGVPSAVSAAMPAGRQAVAADAPAGPPPLTVDKSAPLLLELPDETPKKPAAGRVADNMSCHVCHGNYDGEPFAGWHARANVGCIKCHGQSFEHRADEDNVTPPDVMFPPEKIAANCAKCHDSHDVPAAAVIARWQQRCPGKTDAKQLVCTDCHGAHRLPLRHVRWDKRTGKLISADRAVRMTPAAIGGSSEPDSEMQ